MTATPLRRLSAPLALLAALALWLSATAAPAAQTAVVEGVQLPAWVERGGSRIPLEVGMALAARDRVVTGRDARLLLRLAEGSVVKLGENGVLALDELAQAREGRGTFVRAALDVARGAFRFTTQALAGNPGRRDVSVRLVTVTAGIRGTDLWGKSDDDRDIVCLIEGRISVQRGADPAFAMQDPLSFYIAPRNAAPLPVAPVPREQLEQWAAETEIAPGRGAIRKGGRWKVYLAEADGQRAALEAYDRIRAAGYPAEIRPARVDGNVIYRVRIASVAGEAEARALGERLRAELPGLEPRVSLR